MPRARRSCSRSARWATSWSRWCASRWSAPPPRPRALHPAAEDGRPGRPAEPQHALRGRQARRRPARPRLGHAHELAARALERVGTTRSTSASRSRSSSRASSASSPTHPSRAGSRGRCRLTRIASGRRGRGRSRTRSGTTSSGRTCQWRARTPRARAFRADPPSLVILDLMLPEMSGLDVCRTLRSGSDVPIIVVTAGTSRTESVGSSSARTTT